DAGKKGGDGVVPCDEVPVPIDGERRERLVTLEHELDDASRRRERIVVDASFRKARRIACGNEQRVTLAKRHVETFRKAQQHLAARRGATGLYEAQVPR